MINFTHDQNVVLPVFLLHRLWASGAISRVVKLKLGSHSVSYPEGMKRPAIGMKGVDLSKLISDTTRFDFYDDPNMAGRCHRLSFYSQWELPCKEVLIEDDSLDWLSPMHAQFEGYYALSFICRSRQGDWLEVVTHEAKQEIKWIKASKLVAFIPCEKATKSFSILFAQCDFGDTVYRKTDVASGALPETGYLRFKILKIEGDWMKVSNDDTEFFAVPEDVGKTKGWVRFRKEGELLVEVDNP